MYSAIKAFLAAFLVLPFLWVGSASAVVIDDEIPEVTARVARISFLNGKAQVRRSGSTEWERAALNLPLVEGDEIATDPDTRIELQFNSTAYLRLEENSYLRITTLRDEGIALSLPEGTLSLRVWEFNKDRSFIEIDAPKTTLAVQEAGTYRIDAGKPGDLEIRMSVIEGGEARIYSETAGFTLKNGRSARIIIDGAYAGEWDTAEAAGYADEFDRWTSERDEAIAKQLKNAYYDRYYDRDVYGAEELNDHGDWIYTRDYGYVWRPHSSATSVYADWSPYRYGHWRWVPPYGWTWVNDEPWGWATYHHGRWVWMNGYWAWTPYGYYRYSRSWWQPALVVIGTWGGNVCWYPLGYNARYYDYNRHNRRNRNWNRNDRPGSGPAPTPTPAPNPQNPNAANIERANRLRTPPLQRIPPTGVVSIPTRDFGTESRTASRPPLVLANKVLADKVDENQTPPILPPFERVDPKIRIEKPRIASPATVAKTGAAERRADAPVDNELQRSRILGNRPPLQINTNQGEVRTPPPGRTEQRDTGAVSRPTVRRDIPQSQSQPQSRPEPTYDQPRREDRRITPPMKREEPPRQEIPRYDPPKRETPRPDTQRREQPRQEAPRYEPPKQDAPRQSPPPRQDTQRPQPQPAPKREDPPQQKSEPKPAPPQTLRRDKDGR